MKSYCKCYILLWMLFTSLSLLVNLHYRMYFWKTWHMDEYSCFKYNKKASNRCFTLGWKLEFRHKHGVAYLILKIYTFGLRYKNSVYVCSHWRHYHFFKFVYFVFSDDAVVYFKSYFATGPDVLAVFFLVTLW